MRELFRDKNFIIVVLVLLILVTGIDVTFFEEDEGVFSLSYDVNSEFSNGNKLYFDDGNSGYPYNEEDSLDPVRVEKLGEYSRITYHIPLLSINKIRIDISGISGNGVLKNFMISFNDKSVEFSSNQFLELFRKTNDLKLKANEIGEIEFISVGNDPHFISSVIWRGFSDVMPYKNLYKVIVEGMLTCFYVIMYTVVLISSWLNRSMLIKKVGPSIKYIRELSDNKKVRSFVSYLAEITMFTLLFYWKIDSVTETIFSNNIRSVLVYTSMSYAVFLAAYASSFNGNPWFKRGILSFITSILVLSDIMYYRYFIDVYTVKMLGHSGQLADVYSSIIKLFRSKDVLLFIDVIVMLLFAFVKMKKRDNQRTFDIKFRRKILLIVMCLCVIINVNFTLAFKNEEPGAFKSVYDRVHFTSRVGSVNYHLIDAYRVILGKKSDSYSDVEFKKAQEFWKNRSRKYPAINEYKGLNKGDNVLYVQIEALQSFVIGLSIDGQEITPNLNKLINDSAYFPNVYSQVAGGNTSDAEFMVDTSLLPIKDGSVFVENYLNELPSMSKELKAQNYSTTVMHANKQRFWNRDAMYKNGIPKDYFYSEKDYEVDQVIGLGLSDEHFYTQSVQFIKNQEAPFFAHLISLSSHHPFNAKGYTKTLNLGSMEGMFIGDYLESINYADRQIGTLIEELKNEGLYDNTLLVIYGDHHAIDYAHKKEFEQYIANKELTQTEWRKEQRVPLIIHSSKEEYNGKYSIAGGLVDVKPTISNLLGLEQSVSLGQDLLNEIEGMAVFRNGSFITNDVYYHSSYNKAFSLGENSEIDISNIDSQINKVREHLWNSDFIIEYDMLSEINLDHTVEWLKYEQVAHALGGIDGNTYTNSKEALLENYSLGHRVFEADFSWTTDGILVARHDWRLLLYDQLQQARPKGWEDADKLIEVPISLNQHSDLKIHNEYDSLSFSELVELLVEYEDIYLVTDTKGTEVEEVQKAFNQIVEIANQIETDVLKRIIPQVYNQEMYYTINDIYQFDDYIYTLYMSPDNDREVVEFSRNANITAVTVSKNRVSENLVNDLSRYNIPVFVHTINGVEDEMQLKHLGVHGVYTDFLAP